MVINAILDSLLLGNMKGLLYYSRQFHKNKFRVYLLCSQWQCSPDRGPSVLSEKKMTMKFRLMLILERDCQARKQKPCRDLRTTDISDLHIRPVQTLINFNISLPSSPHVWTEEGNSLAWPYTQHKIHSFQ